jgi:hypothetical protein
MRGRRVENRLVCVQSEPTCDACRSGPFQFLTFPPSCGSHRMGEDEKSGGIENLRDGREYGDVFFFCGSGILALFLTLALSIPFTSVDRLSTKAALPVSA